MRRALGAAFTLLFLGVGCDVDRWMEMRGIPTFREITVEEANLLLSRRDALLIQVRSPGHSARVLEGATVVDADEPLPDAVTAGPETLVVVATDRSDALGYGARLARAGVPRVLVVQGGLTAWREARAPSKHLKPAGG